MRDWRNLVGILLVAVALLTLVVLFGGAGMMGFGGFNTRLGTIGQGMMGGYNLLGWTVMPAFWALLVGGLGLLVLGLARADARRT